MFARILRRDGGSVRVELIVVYTAGYGWLHGGGGQYHGVIDDAWGNGGGQELRLSLVVMSCRDELGLLCRLQ